MQVYGSSEDTVQALRNFSSNSHGELRQGLLMPPYGKPLLPFSEDNVIDCRRDTSESDVDCFLSGDIRVNEQVKQFPFVIAKAHHFSEKSNFRSCLVCFILLLCCVLNPSHHINIFHTLHLDIS